MSVAAALPEAAFTSMLSLVDRAAFKSGETVLVHGGGSGIGTFALQLARVLGVKVIVTVGSDTQAEQFICLGTDVAINYRRHDFGEIVMEPTHGRNCGVVLDMVAGDYISRSLQVMAISGRHMTIGVMDGSHQAVVPVILMLYRQMALFGMTLRGRAPFEKHFIRNALRAIVWPSIEKGLIAPVVHSIHSFQNVQQHTT